MIALILDILRYAGIVLIIFSIVRLIQLKKIELNGVDVEAVVVHIKENKVRNGRQVYDEYTPILEYTIAQKVYHKAALASQGDKRYDMGDIVQIRCKPDDPEELLILGDRRYYFNPVLIGVAGIMLEILFFLLMQYF
ncbi:DUF3592 domain-containing protein [Acetobacterium carbinolicum]|jgi:hypothetical protein|uniref:DUF3592 domain-containing protein n=1 Tax=Acetobacterium TaxID=33951 RepID=UPI000DBEC84F|nr:DUF3592 domain-containing protein [Acetobacterium sp. KB-1]AWW26066.1 hypothetical protein DOZ58_05005 [Acetobacterium sp. KB-1]